LLANFLAYSTPRNNQVTEEKNQSPTSKLQFHLIKQLRVQGNFLVMELLKMSLKLSQTSDWNNIHLAMLLLLAQMNLYFP
jgi:hypothetical protein